ncbi:hypothetical protein QFZ75_003392 [Streptomyces sp. V3I8]|uniref:hypothetical protein n=1 Tax=Streptomyces sp. V3I8 TaxID=3042279 RepID=UPI002783B00B|nr:hypothetical protein [Streptomyces sp. V3I8]MDQ1036976.1 hypothetical protein [Streptomyces sp. V3I8]
MTHNGQGDEPSARPAREGIVLPSDGGEPLLPGQTGDRAVPAGGQAWDQSWGPRSAPQAPQEPGQGWTPTDEWGSGDQSQGQGHAQGHAQGQMQGQGQDPQISSWSAPPRDTGGQGARTPGWDGSPQGQIAQYGGSQDHQAPYGAQDPGGRWGDPQASGGAIPQGGHGYPDASGGAGPGALPPATPMDEGATQFLPPVAPNASLPGAPSADEGATQFLPPVGPGALPPEMPAGGAPPGASSAESTRYLGRVPKDGPGQQSGGNGAGPLPAAVDPDAQPTQFMAPVPAQPGAPGPGAGAGYGARADGPEDRQQPPAEFDSLFRTDVPGDAGGSTQQLPRFDQPRSRRQQGRQQQTAASPEFGTPAGFGTPSGFGAPGGAGAPAAPDGPGGHGGRRGAADGDHGRGGRSRSRVPLIAAVGVGIAVLGIGAGALLSGGGGDEDKSDGNTTVAATAPATDASGSDSASVGPEEAQAVALDKLLADSGNSRDSVVKAVDNVRRCSNLGQAATDLRDAAKQRNALVTRLAGLSVDKLDNHAQLTAALNSAWRASAAADTHYAAWADQAADKKGCRKGQARSTGQTAAGNRESGTATTQKARAAKLWNSIAQTYGLTERQPGQL